MSRRERAFTLLELLVATGMIAVLAGSLYATLYVVFRARDGAAASIEDPRKVLVAMELLRADMASAVVPKGVLAGAFIGEDDVNEAGREADALLLHCTASPIDRTEYAGDLRMVEIICEYDEDGQDMVLMRRVTPNTLAATDVEPVDEVLCRNVRAFGLRYYDGVDWLDYWDAGSRENTLPSAVEVTILLSGNDTADADADSEGYLMSRVFLLPCSSIVPGQGSDADMLLF